MCFIGLSYSLFLINTIELCCIKQITSQWKCENVDLCSVSADAGMIPPPDTSRYKNHCHCAMLMPPDSLIEKKLRLARLWQAYVQSGGTSPNNAATLSPSQIPICTWELIVIPVQATIINHYNTTTQWPAKLPLQYASQVSHQAASLTICHLQSTLRI